MGRGSLRSGGEALTAPIARRSAAAAGVKRAARRATLAVGLVALSCGGAAELARAAGEELGAALPPPTGCVDALSALQGADPDPRWASPHLIVVRKGARSLQHFKAGAPARAADGAARCWRVGLGFAPEGTKQAEGDGKTPEGWYRTSDKPESSFAHAISVHYPNAEDAAQGLSAGRIDAKTAQQLRAADSAGARPAQETALGGHILIHGGGGLVDWTLGCIALDDPHLLDLRAGLPKGQRAWLRVLP
jgi:hypothetical protein